MKQAREQKKLFMNSSKKYKLYLCEALNNDNVCIIKTENNKSLYNFK